MNDCILNRIFSFYHSYLCSSIHYLLRKWRKWRKYSWEREKNKVVTLLSSLIVNWNRHQMHFNRLTETIYFTVFVMVVIKKEIPMRNVTLSRIETEIIKLCPNGVTFNSVLVRCLSLSRRILSFVYAWIKSIQSDQLKGEIRCIIYIWWSIESSHKKEGIHSIDVFVRVKWHQ